MQRRSWHFEEGCSHTYGHGYLPFLTINQVFNLFGSHFRLLAATSYYLTCQFKFNCKWGFLPVVNTWLNELTTNRRIFVSPLWMPPQCPIIIIFRKIHLTREPLNSAKINQLRAMQLHIAGPMSIYWPACCYYQCQVMKRLQPKMHQWLQFSQQEVYYSGIGTSVVTCNLSVSSQTGWLFPGMLNILKSCLKYIVEEFGNHWMN